ncbi:VOC family protein [Streptomyces durbertensis]|uniref:VOC family protein n=1 Tax=Streptomyces durbertensis TaxID=2448886 RepID=A0ABR6EL76_9ACTN|nr:VOC family protein [Streptomyces durbertensis]MBB1246082.1 VOC family protein [Streptomyces durbertensis]
MPHDDQQHAADEQAAGSVQLNHTVVYATDRQRSAQFLATVLGLEVGAPFGPFLPLDLGNGVTLDYYELRDEPVQSQHYAFLVPEARFDAMIARLEAAGVTYYADPSHTEPGRTNNLFGGRGAYFDDPDGHNMEIMTRPYARP